MTHADVPHVAPFGPAGASGRMRSGRTYTSATRGECRGEGAENAERSART